MNVLRDTRRFPRTFLSIGLSLCCFVFAHAQYFQQEVHYRISAVLDDQAHRLTGQWEMTYTNNSTDQLRKIAVHLYPNAYQSRSSAFAQQQLRLGELDFHFADEQARGMIDSLSFTAAGAHVPLRLDASFIDIGWLILPVPLEPGASLTITTPYRISIPKAFSRLGYIGESYQITQWYPKPAVYDADGWHLISYLDQGEFYGEFGTYEVHITAPANYVIAATGELLSQDARHWRDSLASRQNAPSTYYPPSESQMRHWHFHAAQCHDFAWFADKRFAVRKKEIVIDHRPVTCWAFFTATESELWERATEYVEASVQFYSNHVGPYPYPQMSAVQVPLGKDFGMEYPMITSINLAGEPRLLDAVIAHEVGHNWFYGILGFNERKHPWMDEGINTSYENAYMTGRYGRWSEHNLLWKPSPPDAIGDEQWLLFAAGRQNALSPPDTDPEYLSADQNYFGSYLKPALSFAMLEAYMGPALYQEAMQAFFAEWQFKHPAPADLQQTLEAHCECPLDWLFAGLIGTDQLLNYQLKSWQEDKLVINNKGTIKAPVQILAYAGDSLLYAQWIAGFAGEKMVPFNPGGADNIRIYENRFTLDIDPHDNLLLIRREHARRADLQIRLLGGKAQPGKYFLNLLPVVGWNVTDGFMPGIALSNTYWPHGRLQWGILPLYSTETQTLTGMGEVRYQITKPGESLRLDFALGVKSFHFAQDTHYGFYDRYLKIAPALELSFRGKRAIFPAEHRLRYRFVSVNQDYGEGVDYAFNLWESRQRSYHVHEIQYIRKHARNLSSGRIAAIAQTGKGFVRLSFDVKHQLIYHKQNKSIFFHGFAGALPYYQNPDANASLQFNGIQSTGFYSRDYLYDELLFARNETEGLWSQFIFLKDAQVKTLYNGGISEKWMIGGGVSFQPPLPLPIHPYLDFALYSDPFEGGTQLSYSAGLALVLKKDVVEVYFPLVESQDIRNSLTYLDRDNFWKRISILLDLKAFHPFDFNGY